MASARALALLLAVPLALAGCIGTDDEPVEPTGIDATDDVALPTAPTVTVFDGDIQTSVATPARTLNFGGAFQTELGSFEDSNGFVLELSWDPASPASESLAIWVRELGVGTVDPNNAESLLLGPTQPDLKSEGAGPLRLSIPAGTLDESKDYEIVVRASEPAGVAVNQPFTLYITNFVGVPFDEAFSAL